MQSKLSAFILSLVLYHPPQPSASTEGSVIMDLYFSRRRFFQTGFCTASQKTTQGYTGSGGQFEEIYRVSTTVRKGSILPDTTTIEYVGSEDEEKHYVVATIEWHWPSQTSSIIEIDGNRFSLKDFMKREGLLSTGTHVMIGEERFTWRSAVCRPAQLFNSQNRSVARLTPCPNNVHPFMRVLVVQPSCLHLASELASDAYTRDFAVVSFFVYRACCDLQILLTPWWRKKQADFSEMKLKT